MRRNSVIQIVVVLAAVLAPVLVIGRSEQNHVEVERVRISHVAGDHAHALRTPLGSSLSAPGSPANLRFTHLSVADGLSNADVRAIVQDRQGFMWFGTWLGGLNRYDGYTFKVYKHDDQDDRSLGCDSIWALYVNRAGVLWVGTAEGVDRYDRDTDSFVHYRHRADDPTSLPHYQVRSFYEDESGTLWVSTYGGLSRFDRTSGRFITFRSNPNDPTSIGNNDIWTSCLDTTTGLLWVSTWDEGVSVLDRSTGHFTRYKYNANDPASLSSNNVEHFFEDRTGSLWISTLRGLNRFDPQAHTFIRYLHDPGNPASLSDDDVAMTYEDRAGRFWVATNNGLNLMDRARGTFTRYLHDPNDPSSLSSNVINNRALYVDASGALWIGMRSTGVDRLAGEAENFTTYRHNSQDANSLSDNVITGLAKGSGGALWIGTEAGLDHFDGRTFTYYIADANDPSRLSPGPERSVAQDSHGVVWTGTYGSGLDRLDGGHVKHFRHDPKNSDSPAIDNISSLVPDAKGGLWIGVHGKGMDYFDGRHFTHFPADPENPAGLPGVAVRPLLLDRDGMLWIGTAFSGLVRFDTHTRKFTTYLMDPNQPGNQAVNWTEDVYSDGASIWVASFTGLFRFDPETGKFTHHYTEKDGLANNAVVGILGDNQGNVWVSTAKGLSRFDPRTEVFRNYDVFDGLQGNEFSFRCRAKAPDGRLFFGGVNGLNAFYPDKLADNRTPPPVVLTEFELFNKPVKIGGKDSPLRQAINIASSITLRYDQSVFRFQFAALDFTAPQKNRYAYKLHGFDRDWQYTDATRPFATYTHLYPGDYTFRVKASNNDGVWNEQGVALHIRILPPWWGTWSFRALCVAMFLALLWAAYQFRVHRLQKESKQLRDVIDTIPGYVWSALPDGSLDFINQPWLEFSGVSLEKALGWGWEAAVHPEDRARFVEAWRAAVASGKPMESEARVRRADGHYRWLLIRNVPLRNERGKIVKWYGTSADIDDRKRAEEALRRLNRELRAISNCNQILLRATDEQSLLDEICRIVCEEADYRMVWVAYAEHDEAKSVRPAAWTGTEEAYLANLGITWADTERGRGPTGTAIRSGKTCCIQDFATDPRMVPWRESAVLRDFRSAIALPIKDEHANAFGSLTIYSAQPNAFTSEEIRLLEELAADLAFGIVTLRSQATRKQAEEALRESETRFRTFVDHAADALFIYDFEQGTIVDANRQACESLGYTRQELIGTRALAFHLDSDRAQMESVAQRAAAGETVIDTHWHRRKDGTLFPVEVHTSQYWYGGRRFLLKVARDISDRLRVEEKLRRSEAYLTEGQWLSHTGSFAWSAVTRQTTYWSEEMFRIFGLNPQEGVPTAETFWQRIHPDDLDRVRELLFTAAERGMDYDHDHRIVLPDGTVKHIHAIGHPVLDENGRLAGYVGTAVDVTERKHAEQERERLRQLEADLAHLNRVSMMGELAASVAHEVNQPLAGVVSNGNACLRWLAAGVPNVEEARETARRIVRDGKRAAEVIARIRALSKRAATTRERLDLKETIQDVLALVGDEAKRRSVIIRTQFAGDLLPVSADRVQLQQVMLNLVINAIEAMSSVDDRARETVITTRNVDPDQVQVTVEDSGIGIDAQRIDKIFDSFYTTKPGGMGMGLSICRSILQAHGGRLWATANDGPGTSFHFTLPKYHEEEAKLSTMSETMEPGLRRAKS